VVAAVHGEIAADLLGCRLDPPGDTALAVLLAAEAPVLGGPEPDRSTQLGRLLDATGAWIGFPLTTRDQRVGVLLVATAMGVAYGDAQVEIGAALAGQAMIAYDNARLFARVETSLAELQQAYERERALEVELRHAQKLEAVGRLAGGIAHEINTPIQFITDNVRFLADAFADMTRLLDAYRVALNSENPTPWETRMQAIAVVETETDVGYLIEEAPSAARQTLEGAAHIARIVRAMKAFGRPDGGSRADADLNHALETSVTVATSELKNVADIDLDLAPLPPVSCYLSDLNQVFLNLLVNAAHAIADTGRRGTIRVATRHEGDEVAIEIADNGTGMPEAIRERIFEPFFTTKPVGHGTGQGLSLAHAIVVERHGGSIAVDSTPGEGTTFTIRLKVRGAAVEPTDSAAAPPAAVAAPGD
jgi:signal transduction histidine kinase